MRCGDGALLPPLEDSGRRPAKPGTSVPVTRERRMNRPSSTIPKLDRERKHQARPLRGREPEIARAVGVLRRTKTSGQSSLIFLSGEPGIGKTALLNAIADHGRELAFAVGLSKAEEFDQIAPMAPLLLALRSGSAPLLSRDDFAELAPLYQQQLWLVERLTATLEQRATRSPLLIAIDDAQWVDRLTLFALRIMPPHLVGSPIVWLLASRLHPPHPADEIIASVFPDVPVETIQLGPLTAAAIDEMALDRNGAVPDARLSELLRRADGYPFLAVDLLDGYASDEGTVRSVSPEIALFVPPTGYARLPGRLVSVVRNRLQSLPLEALRLVEVASVLGRSCSLVDAAELLQMTPWTLILPAIEAAVRAGILEDDGQQIAFRHDLFRQAVYQDVPQSVRTRLHRAAAERYMAVGRGPLEVAPHVLMSAESGDRQAVSVLRQAASAVASTMPTVAVELIERAFSLLDAGDPLWLETGEDAISMLASAQRGKDAIAIADQLFASGIDDETAARIQTRAARILWGLGRVGDMRARLSTTMKSDGLSSGVRAGLKSLQVLAKSGESEPADGLGAGEEALREAQIAGSPIAEADALQALGESARNTGRHELALTYFRRLRSVVDVTSPVDELISLQILDRYDESKSLLTKLRVESEDRRDLSKAPGIAFAQMWHDYCLGLLDEAEADAETLLQLCNDFQVHSYQLEARIILSRIAQLRGDLPTARARLAAAARSGEGSDESRPLMVQLMAAWIAETDEDHVAAVASVRDIVQRARRVRHRWFLQPAWLVAATRISIRGGDRGLAKEAVSFARTLAERNPGVATIAGIASQVEGLVNGQVSQLQRAVQLLEGSQRQLVRADAAADLGAMELAAGRRDSGATILDGAWETYTRLGALGEARKVQRLLAAAGIRRRQWRTTTARPLEGWGALTETERRVARLIADGHTNRSAAADLILSPNTVATHLRSIFGKLSVNSRSQLTRVVLKEIG
jgi:DNA-binding CsgD family transcriptional regulator/tetratricopeptide (TPR) repeat protein